MNTNQIHENKENKPVVDTEHGPIVIIEVDNKSVHIHRGHRTVEEIKEAGNVPLAYDLNQVVDGKLIPLPDNGSMTIKGGEKFISHPKDSQSS
jgi:hypothetical protein